MAVKPVVYDDSTKKHRPLGSGEKMDGLSASSIISSQSGNLITTGSDGLAYATGSGIADPAADNLIEATSGGKLKVDMDRIVEWLDGHSADAEALTGALNVVSGDSGNVITEGADKGAYLSKAALANALGSMTDAQLQSLASAIADGQTIVASGGKLIVDLTSVTAAKLKKIAAQLPKSGGGIVMDSSTGKLYVDFNSMDKDIMRDVVMSMVDLEGGLAVYDSGAKKGKLYVDFENMPTDKFEALMAQLRMLVPLESSKTIYVNPTSANAANPGIDVSGWGESKTGNPFLTISGAVSYITQKYSLGSRNVYIRVVEGTYDESVSLPSYSRGSGAIYILSDSGLRDVTVRCGAASGTVSGDGMTRTPMAASGAGAVYHLRDLTLQYIANPTTGSGHVGNCVSAGSNAAVYLYGCRFDQSFRTGETFGGVAFGLRLLNADNGGVLHLMPSEHAMNLSAQTNPYAGGTDEPSITVTCISVSRNGSLWFHKSAADGATGEIACSGSCDTFIYVWQGSSTNTIGTGECIYFSGTMTGKRYMVTTGSYLITCGGGADYFPGDAAGTVDNGEDGRPQTYCWYA